MERQMNDLVFMVRAWALILLLPIAWLYDYFVA